MWADFRKYSETEELIIYSYGFESHDLTGFIEYNKVTKEYRITKKADKKDYSDKCVISYFYYVVSENFPEHRMVATG